MYFNPDYEWICYACAKQNEAGNANCEFCGCPASVTVSELNIYRASPRPLKPPRALFQGLSRHRYEWVVFLLGSLAVVMVSFLPFVREGFTDLSKAGVMGDFFGGYVGTFFSLASVALLLSTFRSQQRATAQQNFESKYFELLKMHRDNVSEFELSGIQGRKVFVPIVREFQAILLQIRRFARTHDYTAEITQSDFVVISYYALFFGVGPNSSRMFRSALKSYGPIFATALDGYLSRDDVQNEIKNHAEISYKPVDGHQSRLGHYYRHLYQTVTYVDDSPFIGNRYGYVKTIRAQLTNYEQALFLVNSFSPMGRAWWDRDLVVKYNLVKNIPRGFFDKSLDVVIEQLFGSEANFEWQEYEDESLK